MKNFAYRHYFSHVSGFSKGTKRTHRWFDPAAFARKSVASLLSGLLVLQPVLLQAQQLTPDVNAPIGNQPGIGAAPNGVPLVDIVTPNAQGLSHNKYGDFNVGTPGLILNNHNGEFGTSKLGGVTPGNANLKNSGPASVILNEVTSGSRSSLLGPTEVFGGRADVIIANPNGITCDGCGFINTPRATLTTGTPDIDGTGRLSGFTVQGGDVTFGSKGGNFASGDGAVDLFDIVSRRIQIDGPVNGKNLRLTAGRQKFDYATGEATALSGADDAGEFAIDGSALGAMQADRIKIVVTDKGAGVRMRNDMAANAGELTLSADGKISLGNASGRDGVSVQSKNRQVEARKITSKKKVVVKAAKGITLEAVSADEDVILSNGGGLLSVASDVVSLGNIELTSSGAITTGNVAAGKNASLQAGQGIASGQVIADGAANLATTSGNIALSGTAKAGGGALTMTATSGSIAAASLVSFNNMTLTAGTDITSGDILSGGALVASAHSLKAGNVVSGVDFAKTNAATASGATTAGGAINGAVQIGSTGDMRLETTRGVEVASLLSAGNLNISASSLAAKNVTSHGTVTISGETNVSGQLLGSGNVSITGKNIAAGAIISGVDFAASKSSNGAVIVGNTGDITLVAQAGTIDVATLLSASNLVGDAATFKAANVTSYGTANISGTTTISGQLLAGSDITVNGPAISIGAAVAGVDLNALRQGNIVLGNGGRTLNLTATAGDLTADRLLSSGNTTASASANLSANILTHGDLQLTSGNNLTLVGQSLSGGNATLAARAMNIGTIVSGVDFVATEQLGGSLTLKSNNTQSGYTTLTANGTIDAGTLLSAQALAVNSGSFNATDVTSNTTANITGATTISGQLLAGSDLSVTGAAINIATAVAGADLIALAKGTITTSGASHDLNLIATAGDLIVNRLLSSGNTVASATENLSANAVSRGDLTLTAGGAVTLSGQSLAGGNATINGASLNIGTLVSGVDFAATEQSNGSLILKTGVPTVGQMTLGASSGSIIADQLLSGGDLKAKAQQNISYNSLQSFASADLNAVLGSISLDKNTVAKGNIALTLQSLDLSNDRSKLATAGTLIVTADNANLSNSTLTFGGIALNLSGSTDASNSKIRAVTANGGSGDITINAQTVVTTSATALLAAHDLTLTLASLTNAGQLAANNNLGLKINNDLTNNSTGLIYAGNNGQLFVNGTISNNLGAILSGNDLTFANYAGAGKNAALINKAGLIQAGKNLSIQTEYLKNEANGEPTIGERQEDGPRYSFGTPDKYDELFDNDTLMRGRLFYDAREAVKWGRGGCRYKNGDPCDVTWLDKGLWNTKEETYGYITLPDGTTYKAFTWNEVGSNDGKGKIWYDWNDQAAMSAQYQSQYFVSKPTIQGIIQANGDMAIDATKIDNFYSSIEAGGNAEITSDHLTNKGVTLYKNVYMTCLADAETCYGYNADGTRNSAADISANASVLVGREAVDSLSSVIRARGALTLNVATTDNTAADGSIAGYARYEAASTTGDPLSALNGITAGGALFTPNAALDALLAEKGLSLSGNGLQAGGISISAAEIAAALGNSAPKPDSGGFGGTLPGQNFIYETRAEFLDVSKFYGSGYYLNRVGYKPDTQMLFLGDAYFENQLIDKQMREATGRGLGSGSYNSVDQMKALLDNGVAYAQSHGLVFGEPLNAEQLAALDSSIVIYVKQNMNGVEVFAPVLYVAAKDREAIVSAGAMIEGNSVVVAGDAVSNSGLIASNTDLRVESTTISATGGGFTANGNLTLAVSNAITLSAGTTTFNGQTVVVPTDAVAAGGNAILQSRTDVNLNGVNVKAGEGLAISGENVSIGVAKGTSVDGSESVTGSNLAAGSDLAIKATNDVSVSGSQIKAGDNLAIAAETGNLTIQSAQANRKDGFGETTTQQKSEIASGGSTSLTADKNVVIAGSDVSSGGNLAVQAGESVAIIATQHHASGSFGSNSFDTTTQQGSNLSSGGDTSVKAGTDILIGASNLDAGGNVDLAAKGDVNIVAMADRNEEHTNGKIYQRNETETNAVGSSISAGGNVKADAGNDLNIIGSDISADGSVGLKAENNVNVLAAESEYHLDSKFKESGGTFGKTRAWTKNEDSTTLTGSSISAGTGVDISSGKDTTIAASKVQAGDKDHKADLNLNAGGDLIIASGKDTVDQDSSKSKSGFLSKKSSTNQNYDETTVASELGASGNVNLNAGDNVAISGSKVKAGDNIAIEGDSVSIIGAQEQHDSASSSKKSGFGVGSGNGFYSVYGKEQKSASENIVANVGSELSAGNDVSIKARESDVNIVGSKVAAGNDIALDAARDVNILPGSESYASEEKEKRSGFGIQVKSGEGSASVGIGFGSSKDETRHGAETNATSALSAGRDVVITAGRDANLQAAKVEAGSTVDILAERDVNLLSAQDKTNFETMHEELFAGITATVSSSVASAASNIYDAAKKVGDGSSSQSIAMGTIAAINGYYAYDALVNGKPITPGEFKQDGPLLSTSITAGFQYSKNSASGSTSTPVPTTIRAGDTVIIEASSGDINAVGAQIAAGYDEKGMPSGGRGDIALIAGNDINLISAQATTENSSKNVSGGVQINLDLTGGNFNFSKGNADGTTVTNVNTHVVGTGGVYLQSGNDTNLKGATVTGETVIADIGGDLNIESQLDTSSGKAKQVGVGGGIGTSGNGISGSYQTAKGDAAIVSEQSGIHAGEGGFDIKVEGNTKLTGGVISSEADPKDNRLETGTLEFEDLDTHSEWKADTYGGGLSGKGPLVSPPIKEGESETGKALSAISPGEIIITDPANQQQNIDDLRRDTTDTNTSLPGIPDLQKILGEQLKTQQLYDDAAAKAANMIGTKAGDLANAAYERDDKDEYEFWKEGGPGRAALHAIAGGLLGGVTDFSGMLSGALGGASSALLAPKIRELVAEFVKESGLTGSAAEFMTNTVTGSILQGIGGVTGGAGAAYAGNAYQFNYLDHADAEKRTAAKAACAQGDAAACETAKQLDEKDERQQKAYVDCRANGFSGDGCGNVLWDATAAMSSYSGIASIYLQQEDWTRIVQDPDVQQQLVNLFAPEGYENLSAEKRAELNKLVSFLVSDPSGFTGFPYLIKKVEEGDLLAIAQFVGLVSKTKGAGAISKALGKSDDGSIPQVIINQQNGAAFEQQVVDAFGHVGGVKNSTPVTVTLPNGAKVTTIPDLWGANVGGLVEAKNVQRLSMSNQLRAQIKIAMDTGQPMNLVISPRTTNVSGPLIRDVRGTGGNIYVYNPSTSSLDRWQP
ncbi:hemagglutinin repeat-containing protein [Ochrobactrum sp. Marseille-Q0166]|uniref:hemagglutinin repeat-containing protein n=1 Tax=Ochrobactrum sp. Marseille-Q0166 TaxID=2761105 RepID=UPI0016557B84|nr:hemagglutinin repeat-containing protein [Ochrobactrum sp. Marseille-Q0166]MBC8719173.1 hemagglutinin repeat-containing protein [Ochrobactrum sp. Marseille-Q0166]